MKKKRNSFRKLVDFRFKFSTCCKTIILIFFYFDLRNDKSILPFSTCFSSSSHFLSSNAKKRVTKLYSSCTGRSIQWLDMIVRACKKRLPRWCKPAASPLMNFNTKSGGVGEYHVHGRVIATNFGVSVIVAALRAAELCAARRPVARAPAAVEAAWQT